MPTPMLCYINVQCNLFFLVHYINDGAAMTKYPAGGNGSNNESSVYIYIQVRHYTVYQSSTNVSYPLQGLLSLMYIFNCTSVGTLSISLHKWSVCCKVILSDMKLWTQQGIGKKRHSIHYRFVISIVLS